MPRQHPHASHASAAAGVAPACPPAAPAGGRYNPQWEVLLAEVRERGACWPPSPPSLLAISLQPSARCSTETKTFQPGKVPCGMGLSLVASDAGAGGLGPPSTPHLAAWVSLCQGLPVVADAPPPPSCCAALSGSLSASLSAASPPASWGLQAEPGTAGAGKEARNVPGKRQELGRSFPTGR